MKKLFLCLCLIGSASNAFADHLTVSCSKDKLIWFRSWHYDIGVHLNVSENFGYVDRVENGDNEEVPAMRLVKITKTEDAENIYLLNNDGVSEGDAFNLYLTDLHKTAQDGDEEYVGTLHSHAGHFTRMLCFVSRK